MIKYKDLRIGNKLQKETGGVFTVLRLDNSDDILVEEQRGLLSLNYNLFGILITPEILEKCGFKETGENIENYTVCKWALNKFEFWAYGFDETFTIYINYDKMDNGKFALQPEFKHLHQLQNLYHILTGEELNIKP